MKAQVRGSTCQGTGNIHTNAAACMIRVIVADDHAILRQGLVKLLCSSGGVAVEWECLTEEKDIFYILRRVNLKDVSEHEQPYL